MKDFKRNILKLLLIISERKYWGVVLFFISPVVHNLHNILPDSILQHKIDYHKFWYYFLWSIEHSLSPCVALFGCFLISDSKLRYFIGFPFGYLFYKAFEKIPIRENYSPHEEFIWIAILFSFVWLGVFKMLDSIIFNINHKVRHSIITLKYISELAQSNQISKEELGRETEKQANKLESELKLIDK